MAHRTNVIQVLKPFETKVQNEAVTDPICKMNIIRRDSKSSIYQGGKTFYFCSKECKNKFVHLFAQSGIIGFC